MAGARLGLNDAGFCLVATPLKELKGYAAFPGCQAFHECEWSKSNSKSLHSQARMAVGSGFKFGSSLVLLVGGPSQLR